MRSEFVGFANLLFVSILFIYLIWVARSLALKNFENGVVKSIFLKHINLFLNLLKFSKNRARRKLKLPQFLSLFFMMTFTLLVIDLVIFKAEIYSLSEREVSMWFLLLNLSNGVVYFFNKEHLEARTFFENSTMVFFKILFLQILSYSIYVENRLMNSVLAMLYFVYSNKIAFQHVLKFDRKTNEAIEFSKILYTVSISLLLMYVYLGRSSLYLGSIVNVFYYGVVAIVVYVLCSIEKQKFTFNELEKRKIIFGSDLYLFLALVSLRLLLWMN